MRTTVISLLGFVTLAALVSAQTPPRHPAGAPPSPPEAGVGKLFIRPEPLLEESLKGLCDASDVVVDAMVQKRLPSRWASRTNMETDFLISVTQVLKGPKGLKAITVSQPGGTIEGLTIEPQNYSLMAEKQRYILFLKNDERQSTPQSSSSPPYIVTSTWFGLFLVNNGVIQPTPTRPVALQSYHGMTADALIAAVAALVPKP